MNLPVKIPLGAALANAIGAALAKPTISASLRADTSEGYYLIPESGEKEQLPSGFGMAMAERILSNWLLKKTENWQFHSLEVEVISKEFFRTMHSYYDTGEIISVTMQIKPGILNTIEGKEVEF